ncbi:twin-arginine translocation signal domain-containing protein [Streptomyces sp. NPDC050504]|uniref:twin-arginine translocation signal domain-containing protein n=1 Tax=Streptomyces sp. NPDC050504 TaxID=3365618 RepID=UPI0037B03D0A
MRRKLLKAVGCGVVAAATTLVVGIPLAHQAGAAEPEKPGVPGKTVSVEQDGPRSLPAAPEVPHADG